MTYAGHWMKVVLIAVLTVGIMGMSHAYAADLPLAAASPLSGVAFDDRPLLLPVQRNFQMAMLTAGSELGRSCGKMEAYGWRMSQTEQGRVNQIFNNTVDRMRLMGYSIQPQTLNSVSKDITLFTADNASKHFIFLWSAGELGLVMTLCETSAPLPSDTHTSMANEQPVQIFPVPMDVVSSHLDAPGRAMTKASSENFTPLGEWIGGYTCEQGYTGGTLVIAHLNGRDFEGEFKFYPTTRNPTVPPGSYTVYGQYDTETKRILINPGKWTKRPANFYNTVIVGGFDPLKNTFSSYFQGISGCTSFEAKRESQPLIEHGIAKRHTKAKHVVKKKPIVAKTIAPAASVSTDTAQPTGAPAAQTVPAAPAPAPAPAVAAPAAATPTPTPPASPASSPASVQLPTLAPASTPLPSAPPAPEPTPAPPSAAAVPSGGGILLTAPSSSK